jgi:acetaldehyde dehydrogenase
MTESAEQPGGGRVVAAILGPGNIGTDLMYKIAHRSEHLSLGLMAGIKADSTGLRLAAEMGVATSTDGIEAVLAREDIDIVFDATVADAHLRHAPALREAGKVAVDLTPAAVGPYVVPVVNLDEHIESSNINLITCGGQATIPIVDAISSVVPIAYAEIVATIASKSAGPGTRDSIDEFTRTTANGLVQIGRAREGKAIILLNPADPPMLMNNTVYALVDEVDETRITDSVTSMVEQVRRYVPGFRLKIPPTFDGNKVIVMIEVEGSGDYLPVYSGNLDIETSAALAVGDQVATHLLGSAANGASGPGGDDSFGALIGQEVGKS